MIRPRDGTALAAILCLAGCISDGDAAQGTNQALVTLADASGQVRASAVVTQLGGGVRVRVEAAGLAPGAYGAHLHTTGRCDPPGFESAGPHWNPASRQHGKDNPQGMHRGDLPNLLVGTDGRGSFEIDVPDVRISGSARPMLLDADGTALVIHASPDDYRTDPSGNSGARIACGVMR